MAWIRLSDDYNDHPKISGLSDGAFRLWHQGMGFVRKYQTDGHIPLQTLRGFKAYSPKRMRELLTPWREGEQPLWHAIEGFGVTVHDYLVWNLSKEEENQQREESKQRMALGRDPALRTQLRLRDGERCRYCGDLVSWTDRRGPKGATYDHVDPAGGNSIENLVIACRGCNSTKGRRTPAAAGMTLRPPIAELDLRTDLNRIQKVSKLSLDISGKGSGREEVQEKGSGEKPADADAIGDRARWLMESYPEWYRQERKGARHPLIGGPLQFQDACVLVSTWENARLEKLARIVLTTDDEPFIGKSDRGFKIFTLKATWADDRLTAWEAERKPA